MVSNEPTDRTLCNVPVILLTLDVDDGGSTRRMVYEHSWGPRAAKRYKPGMKIGVCIDKQDPTLIALTS